MFVVFAVVVEWRHGSAWKTRAYTVDLDNRLCAAGHLIERLLLFELVSIAEELPDIANLKICSLALDAVEENICWCKRPGEGYLKEICGLG